MARWCYLTLLMIFLAGCGQAAEMRHGASYFAEESRSPPAASEMDGGRTDGGDLVRSDAAASRKIIYTGTVDLVTADFSTVEEKIAALVKQAGGYIAEFRENRTHGQRLAGRWVVRVPVPQFQSFLDEVVKLGVPETRQIAAQDVTEEYVDLEARLANHRRLEKRFLELLDNRTGDVKDVIAVERELGRVREEIERVEGRLRLLSDRIALTTVTITVREDRSYTPPQAPTFAVKVQRAFYGSLSGLIMFGEFLALSAVAVAPWLVTGCVVLLPFGLFWMRRRKRM